MSPGEEPQRLVAVSRVSRLPAWFPLMEDYMTEKPADAEFIARYARTLMSVAHVDLNFALCYMTQRKHTFNYNNMPEHQARMEMICWPGVVSFFS